MVNVTPVSLADETLARCVNEQLAAHKVDGERLVLQLSEVKVFTHLRAAQDFAVTLAYSRCKVGLEQFGIGLDSFQLLQHFDPAYIKLDSSFTEELPKNAASQQRIRVLVEKANSMGIRTIAEFVPHAASM